MNNQPTRDQVLLAINTLYSKNVDPEWQKQANSFLMSFSEMQEAWDILVSLCSETSSSPDIQYFITNMLYTKIRREWNSVSEELKMKIGSRLMAFVGVAKTSSSLIFSGLALQRICLALGAISIATPNGSQMYMQEAFSLAATGKTTAIMVCLEMAFAISEEKDSADLFFQRKEKIEEDLNSLCEPLLDLIEMILSGQMADAAFLRVLALKCLKSWSKLAGVSFRVIYETRRAIFTHLLNSLTEEGNILDSVVNILCDIIRCREYPPYSKREEAILHIVNGILHCQSSYCIAIQQNDEQKSHALTTLMATVAEAEVEWIAKGSEEAMKFIRMLLQGTGHPNRQIGSLLLDFWIELQSIPPSERHPLLRESVYIELLDILISNLSYPVDFISWDTYDGELDQDDWTNYRNSTTGVSEVMVIIYYLLRSKFLLHLLSTISENRGNWSSVEARIFSIFTISREINKRLQDNDVSTDILYDKKQTSLALESLMKIILETESYTNNPLLLNTICCWIGNSGVWINQLDPSQHQMILRNSILYVASSLQVQQAQSSAARGIRQLVAECTNSLSQIDVLKSMIDSLEKSLSCGLNLDDRALVTEGIVRIAVRLPLPQAISHLETLTAPTLHRVGNFVSNPVENVSTDQLLNDLKGFATMMRFLEVSPQSDGSVSIAEQILRSTWSLLETCATVFSSNVVVMDALFDVLGWSMRASPSGFLVYLPGLVQIIASTYQKNHFCSALECTSIGVEVVSRANLEAVKNVQELLEFLNQSTFEYLQSHILEDSPQLIQSYFDMIYRFLLFSPASIIASHQFPILLQLSLACLKNQHRESTRSVIIFLNHLISKSDNLLKEYKNQIDCCVQANGDALVGTIVMSLAVASPSTLIPHFGELFYSLFSVYGNNIQPSLKSIFNDQSLGVLSVNDKTLLLELLYKLSQQGPKARFKALILDFSKICRSQMTSDALLAYQM